MKANGRLLLLAICISLVGCASNKHWSRSGTSREQAERDLADCKFRSNLAASPLAPVNLGFAIAEGTRQRNLIRDCMLSKGYSLGENQAVASSKSYFKASDLGARNSTLEASLIGRWKSDSISAHERSTGVTADEMEMVFQPNNLLIATSIIRGKSPFVTKGYWLVVDQTLYIGDDQSKLEPSLIRLAGDDLSLAIPAVGVAVFKKQN